MPLIQAQSIYKTYRLGRVHVPVLRGTSLEVDQGEWVAILGASGSGKSTLLHILGGLDRPDRRPFQPPPSVDNGETALRGPVVPAGFLAPPVPTNGGTVLFLGQPLEDFTPRGIDGYRNLAVGFVFQFYHLLPELRVIENVTIGAMVKHGLSFLAHKTEVRQKAEELLTAFGLAHRLNHRPAQLSGGERQRVAIARALINDPPLLLADEPTGNLDRKTGHAILDSLAEHRSQTKRTMVIVTHDMEVARRADRIVRLEDGRIAGENVVGKVTSASAAASNDRE